jgi:hypothetical protein
MIPNNARTVKIAFQTFMAQTVLYGKTRQAADKHALRESFGD